MQRDLISKGTKSLSVSTQRGMKGDEDDYGLAAMQGRRERPPSNYLLAGATYLIPANCDESELSTSRTATSKVTEVFEITQLCCDEVTCMC